MKRNIYLIMLKSFLSLFLPKYYDDIDDFIEDKWVIETEEGESVPVNINIRIYELLGFPSKSQELIDCLINDVYQNYVRGDVTQDQMFMLEKKLKDKQTDGCGATIQFTKSDKRKLKRNNIIFRV